MDDLKESGKSSMYGLSENADYFGDKNDSISETGGSREAGNGWCDYTQRRFFFTSAYIILKIEIFISSEIIRN